jgi:hypothetical protein
MRQALLLTDVLNVEAVRLLRFKWVEGRSPSSAKFRQLIPEADARGPVCIPTHSKPAAFLLSHAPHGATADAELMSNPSPSGPETASSFF